MQDESYGQKIGNFIRYSYTESNIIRNPLAIQCPVKINFSLLHA